MTAAPDPTPAARLPFVRQRFLRTNGIRMHIAESGPADGPAVVLCHGFPESWYSWRHQLRALGEAGYHVIAPDQRGYGQTDSPDAIDEYTQLHLVGDLVGLLDELGIARAVVVGHDWGAPVAWNAAALRPDRFVAISALSVHWSGYHPFTGRPTDQMRLALQGGFLYVLHFQEPGVAEAELDADIRRSMAAFLYSLSGDIPRSDYRFFDPTATGIWGVLTDAPGPLPWLSTEDLDVFTAEFERKGTFRGGINWYRNIDANAALCAAFVGRRVDQPALFIGAEHDSIFGQTRDSVEATRAAVPQLQQVWIDGSGHWVQQERPDEVNAALLTFLGSLPDYR
jgi:pimeloyl-ACP methyl ester carboxylesterase